VTGSGTGPGPVPFMVTPTAATGVDTTIGVHDNQGGLVFLNVTITGPLTPNPPSLTFSGTTAAQNFTVSDPNYSGTINASSADPAVATVTSSSTSPGASFTVTPVGSGSTSINVTDLNGGKTSVGVTVTSASLNVSTNSVSLAGVGDTALFTATENLYSGKINAVSSDIAVATVAPASRNGPGPVSFTITAVNSGTATVTVSDDHGGSQPISVTVVVAPTVSPGTLSFTDVGAPNNKTVSVSEPGYNGVFSFASNTCPGIAGTTAPGSGPSGSVTVTPLATAGGGSCHFAVKDSNGLVSPNVAVTVGLFGPVIVTPSPNPLGLTVGGSSGSFAVSETNYTGSFTHTEASCAGIATVSGSTPNFAVSPVSAGNCAIVVSDDHTQSTTLDVFVAAGSLIVSPNTLSFPSGSAGATQTFTASDSACGAIDTLSANADGTVAASVAPSGLQACQGVIINFTVTAGSDGQGSVIVTDSVGGSATVSVGVGVSPLVKHRRPLQKTKAQPIPNQPVKARPAGPSGGLPEIQSTLSLSATRISLTIDQTPGAVTVSEPGYSGTFTVSVDNPRIAQVLQLGAPGPQHVFSVAALSAGTTVIRFSDANGHMQMLTVTVVPRGAPGIPGKGKIPL
jgi:hypothetical protein